MVVFARNTAFYEIPMYSYLYGGVHTHLNVALPGPGYLLGSPPFENYDWVQECW